MQIALLEIYREKRSKKQTATYKKKKKKDKKPKAKERNCSCIFCCNYKNEELFFIHNSVYHT
jgi:hypothetical protein